MVAATSAPAIDGTEPPVRAERLIRVVAVSGLAVMALLGFHAALELRPLFADGFQYFNAVLQTESPNLPTPARRLTEWVMQLPLTSAIGLGVRDPDMLAVILALGLQLLPLALTAACWPVLPAGRKHFFLFPLLHYLAGTTGAGFAAIAAGSTAAAAFWLLFCHLLFRATHARAIDIALLLAVPTFFLHEAMVFLAPVLALTALWRASAAGKRGDRAVLVLLACVYVAIAINHAGFIANPTHVGHGAGFVAGFLAGGWLVDYDRQFNLPAIFGAAALVLLGALALLARRPGRWPNRLGWAAVALFAVASVSYAALHAVAGDILAASAQFAARNNAVLVSLPLALVALHAAVRPNWVRAVLLRQVAATCAVMAVLAAAWDAHATHQWSRYVGIVRGVLESNRGFVEWRTALDMLPAEERRLLRLLTHPWTVSPLCFALSPGGKVKTILGETDPVGWRPFDPRNLNALPRSRFWDTREYRDALFEASADTEWR